MIIQEFEKLTVNTFHLSKNALNFYITNYPELFIDDHKNFINTLDIKDKYVIDDNRYLITGYDQIGRMFLYIYKPEGDGLESCIKPEHNSLYCSCSKPNLVKRETVYNTFKFCTICRKEFL